MLVRFVEHTVNSLLRSAAVSGLDCYSDNSQFIRMYVPIIWSKAGCRARKEAASTLTDENDTKTRRREDGKLVRCPKMCEPEW